MRAAPAVSVRCTGAWPWRLLNLLLPACAAAALAAWAALQAGQPGGVAAAGAAAAAAATVGLALPFTRPRPVRLDWDGQGWQAGALPVRPRLMIDAGTVLLLKLRFDDRSERWLAVSAAEAGPAWHALRVALLARPRAAAPAPADARAAG